MESYSYVKVTGSSVADYKIDTSYNMPGFNSNMYIAGYGTTVLRGWYFDLDKPGDGKLSFSPEQFATNEAARKAAGLWLKITDSTGQYNSNGEYLEFIQLSHIEETFHESGKIKTLAVSHIYHYEDQPIEQVKEQLKSMLIGVKESKINVPYNFKSKDGKINLDFNMSQDARYNIRDAYYLQQDMKSSDISFFIENTPIRLPKKYIKELFVEVNKFIYDVLIELERQMFNVDSTDDIFEAQMAAEWVYEGIVIPSRERP